MLLQCQEDTGNRELQIPNSCFSDLSDSRNSLNSMKSWLHLVKSLTFDVSRNCVDYIAAQIPDKLLRLIVLIKTQSPQLQSAVGHPVGSKHCAEQSVLSHPAGSKYRT